jgi:hypothetical protein
MATEGQLRATLILAGRRIVQMNFGRRDDPVLAILWRVLRDARGAAKERQTMTADPPPGSSARPRGMHLVLPRSCCAVQWPGTDVPSM